MFIIRIMKLSDGVEWGVHCAVVLGFVPGGAALPTARLAEYHGVPAAYLAKHLQAMSRAGIVEATHGPRGGYRLARPPAAISILEVVEAIDGHEPAFRCHEIRRRGPAAVPAREYRVPCMIHAAMDRADEAWRAELRAVSIGDLMTQLLGQASPRALELGARWIQEVVA
jgi:Rrf2 family protein